MIKAHLFFMKQKGLLLFALLWSIATLSVAQSKYSVKGSVIDKETSEALMGANVQVLSLPDSTLVTGAMANDLGAFSLKDLKQENYVLKITFMGYVTRTVPLNLKQRKGGHQVDLGYLTLSTDSKMLQEAVVSTTVAKVQVSGDSIQFNPSAYRVPQGSTLEALVKLLPGAEVDDDGNITINGKSVSKILVDGKEFFLNDKSVAMKNIPIDIIDKIKSYERKSDMARITGVDDGEEETVLDLSVKKGKKNGWFGNANIGIGDQHRYNTRGIANYFNENTTVTAIGNGRNVPEQRGWPQPGLNSYKEGGMNFASQNTTMETGGSVSYKYNGTDRFSQSNTHNLTAPYAEYSKSKSQSYGSNHSLEAQFKMEWRPDTMTTILFRPNFTYSNNSGMSWSSNGGFYDDVSEYSIEEALQIIDNLVNSNENRSQSHSNRTYAQGDLQYTRRLNKPGRNVTLRVTVNYTQSESQNLSAAHVYNSLDTISPRLYNNRYYDTPARNHTVAGQFVWNEPIGDRLYASLSYRYSSIYNKNDRQAFVYDSDAYADLVENLRCCRYDVDEVLRLMREAEYNLRDTVALSQYSERRTYRQRIGLQIRQVREKYNFSAGVDAFPETSKLDYRYMGKEYPEISRSVFNLSPRMNLKVNFDKSTSLQMRYNGRTTQPEMTDMLDIEDDSNPLRIRKGNPNLKPSMSHNWNANFQTYNAEKQRGLWSWLYGGLTRNSISNLESYGENSVVTSMPMNINGNWNIGAGVGGNFGLGKEKKFSVGGNVGGGFRNDVGYFSSRSNEVIEREDGQKETIYHVIEGAKSITQRTDLNLGLNTSYRNDYVSVELRGNIRQTYSDNNINKAGNLNTQDFRYGSEVRLNAPWNMEIASNIYMNSRRGYSEKTMNTDELLWNASVAQSFLKGNALTIKGEVFDILGQQTNINRSVSASFISDTRNNGIYQYGLISLIYRFSVFAGRNTMGTKDERREDGGGRPRRF